MAEEKKSPDVDQVTEDAADNAADDIVDKTAQLEAALKEQEDQYLRLLAEYTNYKRRTEQEKENIGQFAKSEIMRQLLPSLDNLERAISAPDGPEYRKGVEMIIAKMQDDFLKLGLAEIPALGEPFDPEVHHAVMREDADGVEPDTVTEVFQKGYRFGDRIIRPAMVKVAN